MSESVILGIDFGGSKIAVGLAETSGERIATSVVLTEPDLGARWNLDLGISAARTLLATKAGGRSVGAVGACTFGIPLTRGVALAPAIPGWSDLCLEAELKQAFGAPTVRVATDVKAAATAEASLGALAGHDPAIYLNLGTGLAVAIVAGGVVIVGANGAAGEIGYCLRYPEDVETGPEDHGVLEDVVSGRALAIRAQGYAGVALTAAEVFEAEHSDERIGRLLSGFVRELSFHVVNLAVVIDPSRIAVGGGMVRSWPRLEPWLTEALKANVPYPPELVVGAFPFDAALIGALLLGVGAASSGDGNDARDGRDGNINSDQVQDEHRSEDRRRVQL